MTVVAAWGIESWSPEVGLVFEHESTLTPSRIAVRDDGVLRVQGDHGAPLVLHDELWALMLHAGMKGPVACLHDGASGYGWRLTSVPGLAGLRTVRDRVELHLDGRAVSGPAAAMWPALVGVAARFFDLLCLARGADHPHVRRLREPLEAAQRLVRDH